MAVTLIQKQNATPSFGGLPTSTFGAACTPGSTLAIIVAWASSTGAGTRTLNTITDGVNTYTLLTPEVQNSSGHYDQIGVQLGYITGQPSSSALSPQANFDVNPSEGFVQLYELTASVFDQQNGGIGNSAHPSAGAITTPSNGCFGVAGFNVDDGVGRGGDFTAGAGWTLDLNFGGGSQEVGTEHQAQTSAGSLTGDATIGNGDTGPWVAAMATFKTVAAAAALRQLEQESGRGLILLENHQPIQIV